MSNTKYSMERSSSRTLSPKQCPSQSILIRGLNCHLLPLSTCLMFYLFCSAHVFTLSMAAQKQFIKHTRYGRRSDLPALAPSAGSASLANQADAESSFNQDLMMNKNLWFKPATLIEGYSPLWCVTLDPKNHIYKCFDKYSLMQRRLSSDGSSQDLLSVGSTDQDQS